MTTHGAHEWYWRNILRRECVGLTVAHCGHTGTHVPHWHGEYRDEWCLGSGLAGMCEHGVQMLDECRQCENWLPGDAA
jgi:hypothetical protein